MNFFELILFLSDKLSDKGNGMILTFFGTILGYTPAIMDNSDTVDMDRVNVMLQHGVWTITIIIGVLTIVGFIQKQIDRVRERRNKKK